MSSRSKSLTGSKLYRTLGLLTAEEWRGLETWLQSPVATGRTAPHRAYRALHHHFPDFAVDKQDLYRAIYGKKPYDNRSLNNLLSELNRLVEDYLLLRRVRHDSARRTEALRRIYLERGALELHAERADAQLAAAPPTDEWALLDRLRWQHDAYFYAPEDRLYADEAPHLEGARHTLDAFTSLLRTKLDFERSNRRAMLGAEATVLKPADGTGKVRELYARFGAQSAPDLAACQSLSAHYRDAFPALPVAYRRLFGIALLNRLIRLNGAAGSPALLLYVRHLRFLDRQDLLSRNGYLLGTTYLNAVAAALLIEDYAYGADLARRYAACLPAHGRQVITSTANARIAFARGEFETALTLATQPAAHHPRYEILRRMVKVKAALEISLLESSAAIQWTYAVDNFERYLRRNRYYSESRLTPFLHFSLLLRRLGHALLPTPQPARLHRVRKAVREKPCYGEKWLLDVIGRYEKEGSPTS